MAILNDKQKKRNSDTSDKCIRATKHPVRRVIMYIIVVPLLLLIFLPRLRSAQKKGRKGPQFVISNHNSIFDPAFLYVFARTKHLHFIAKESLFKNPFSAFFVQAFDAFPINRDESDIHAARQIISELKNDNIVGIFIEGKRTDGGDAVVNPPKATVVQMAIKKNIPIQLCSVTGKMHLFSRPKVVMGPTIILHLKENKKLNKQDSLDISNELMRRIYNMGGMTYINPDEDRAKAVFRNLLDVEILDDGLDLWDNV